IPPSLFLTFFHASNSFKLYEAKLHSNALKYEVCSRNIDARMPYVMRLFVQTIYSALDQN
uniref:Uncharacterized protein n=1 Tax=Romanomermis culicivorax TaxID=13658 RepID=A0A915KY84_ROMCU